MDRPNGEQFATRSVVFGRRGMVATSQPLATEIGLATLKRGGSAVDAAIAANAALGLMEPTGCGIGGDLFAIVWDAGRRTLAGLNASGRSPCGLTAQHFERAGLKSVPERGALAVSVPGAVDGWFELHARFGRLPFAELLGPSIDYARAGFPVSPVIADAWAAGAHALKDLPGFAEVFLPQGRAPAAGDTFSNPGLAAAYERLARDGRDAFYAGPIAAAIERCVAGAGGYLRAADLAAHRSDWVEPVSTTYRGWRIVELPPNGQGIAVLEMLNLLEGYDLGALGFGTAEHLHLLIEAKKIAFEDRGRLYADPEFADVPVAELISKDYAARRRAEIDLARAAPSYGAGGGGDTIYLAAADADGNMVSLIQSNYMGFGSGLVPVEYGFGLQNRGTSFALAPDHPNAYRAGKRPFHTIIPGFGISDKNSLLAFGVMGADMQPQGHVQVLTNMIDFGMHVQAAGDAPRIRHDGSTEPTGGPPMVDGGSVALESGFAPATLAGLVERGHRIVPGSGGFGGYQAILRDVERGVYAGASESRKDGYAAGY